MNKKKLDVTAIKNELEGASVFFQRPPETPPANGDATGVQYSPARSSIAEQTSGKPTNAQEVEQKIAQKTAQMSKGSSTQRINFPSSDEIEDLSHRLRKTNKTKVNAEVPLAWKKQLDDVAHELGIGKYELVMYIIGAFLGEVNPQK